MVVMMILILMVKMIVMMFTVILWDSLMLLYQTCYINDANMLLLAATILNLIDWFKSSSAFISFENTLILKWPDMIIINNLDK